MTIVVVAMAKAGLPAVGDHHHFTSRLIRNEEAEVVIIIIIAVGVEAPEVIITLPFLQDLPKTVVVMI